jgi:hypothetical protein
MASDGGAVNVASLDALLYERSRDDDSLLPTRAWLEAQLTESGAYYDAIGEAPFLKHEHPV